MTLITKDSVPLWRTLLLPTAALGSITLGWGFTVDDALISTRVAHHLWTLGRYSFNPEGPRVDSVTPLGWAWILAPFARTSAWGGLEAARLIGAACTLVTAWVTGLLFGRTTLARNNAGQTSPSDDAASGIVPWQFMLPAAGLWLVNLPLGAWAVSGMETPVVMLLCTLATWGCVENKRFGYGCAGVAAGLRPELIPWALVLGVGCLLVHSNRAKGRDRSLHALATALLIILPVVLVAVVRWVAFGSPTPLAVLAKPSDAASGFVYVRSGLLLLGIPVLLLGLRAWRDTQSAFKCVGLSLGAHCLALVAAGGDWMSLFRLFIPTLPSILWLGVTLTTRQRWQVQVLKYAFAFVPSALLHVNLGPASSQVMAARKELVVTATPLLAQSQRIATLDIGWVGAATNRHITDLAGVTDIEVAVLPGGHTSKRLLPDILERRGIDTLVLLLNPGKDAPQPGDAITGLEFARSVENRVSKFEQAEAFRVLSALPLRGTNQHYVILKRP